MKRGTLANMTLVFALVLHVAATGNDSNPGTESAPFRSIQRAADAASPGDTVTVHPGTYAGFAVTTRANQGAPIAFVAEGTVAIDGAATANRDAILVDGGAWITIEGFTVTGAQRAGIAALDCEHVTVRGNRVDQNGRWGVFSAFCDDFVVERNEVSRSASEHGVYASNSADRPVIRDNVIWGNGMCGVHMNGDINFGGDGVISNAVVERNTITGNGKLGGSAINGDGVTDAVIRNNVLDDNHASGISLYMIDGGAASTGNAIVNNTIRMAADARWAINIQDGSSGNTLRNNIVLHPNANRGAIDICDACLANMKSDHNAVVGRFLVGGAAVNLDQWRTRTGGDVASFVATSAELFADGSLALRSGSPAIDHGMADGAPAVDVAGTARPQGAAIDIGAFEFCDGECVGGDGDDGGDGSDDGTDPVDPPADEPGETTMKDSGGCSTGANAGWLVALFVATRRRRSRERELIARGR